MVEDNLKQVLSRICETCSRVGRDPDDVVLVGVTKFADIPAINEAIRAGLWHIAENKVQLAKEKFPELDLAGHAVTKHMIGHLQTNKVKDALQTFDLIQSVDSIKLVDEIEKRAALMGKVADILVQLDVAQEEQKFGLPLDDVVPMMAHLNSCEHIRTFGLMAMAPLIEDKAVIRSVFRRLREIFERLKKEHFDSGRIQMKYLSMGMSSDYEIALEEGANMLRIGSAIFK